MLEVVLAASARAWELVDLEGRRWRQGACHGAHLAVGLLCPVCAASVVAVVDEGLSAHEAQGLLRQAGRCLHQAAGAAEADVVGVI